MDEHPKHVSSPIAWVVVGYLAGLLVFFGLVLFVPIIIIKVIFGRNKK
jgi:hypothetical protein